MPFTFAHAAAALPLRFVLRGAAVFPALVIGCFIPDVPYFLPGPLANINAHRLPALILFGIPCGWTLHALWRRVFLRPSIALLPRRWGLLLAAPDPQRAAWWATTLSFLAGAASHVAWDAFTHRRGLVVQAWPVLAHPLAHVGGHALPPYALLQHGSSILGIAVLALHFRRRLRDIAVDASARDAAAPLPVRARIVVVATLILAAAALACAPPLAPTLYDAVCRSVSSAALVAAIYALAWHVFERSRAR
jgi:hypothetical protein